MSKIKIDIKRLLTEMQIFSLASRYHLDRDTLIGSYTYVANYSAVDVYGVMGFDHYIAALLRDIFTQYRYKYNSNGMAKTDAYILFHAFKWLYNAPYVANSNLLRYLFR